MNLWEKIYSLFQTFPESSRRETYDKISKEDMGIIALCLSPIGFFLSAVFYFHYNAVVGSQILLGHMIVVLILGILRHKTYPKGVYQNSFIFLYYTLFTSLSLVNGGTQSQNIFWLPTVSIVASSFLTRKATIGWTVLSFITISLFFSGSLDPYIIKEIPEKYLAHYFYVSTASMTIALMMIAMMTETERLKTRIEKEDAIRSANRTSNLASLGEVAGGIAHEINNPLMIISGSAMVIEKAIRKEEIDTAKIAKHTNTIKKTSQRAAVIIKGLKTLSRDGEFDAKEPCQLSEIFEEVVGFLHAKIRNHEVELQFNTQNPLLKKTIPLYRVQFSQVILNLLKNSIEALDESNMEDKWVRVEIEETKEESLVIKISDSGKGIPEEVQEKMFTPFFTTKPVGVGTGLGLPLCYTIIKKSCGVLEYDNSSDHTMFKITLPKEALQLKADQEAA